MKKTILLLSVVCSMAQGKLIPRNYNDEATHKLQNLVEHVELWAGLAKPEFLNEVEKLIREENANPNVKDSTGMSLTFLLMRTPFPRNQLFPIDIPMLEKTFKVVLDHGADVYEIVSGPYFPGNIIEATPTMIQMLLDHMPRKNQIQERHKQETKDKIIQSVKKNLEFETENIAMRKKNNAEYAREKNKDPQVESSLKKLLEESEKEADRLRKILEVLGEPATNMQPKIPVDAKKGIRTNPIPQ
jgi:hypothetical protein